MAEVCLAERRKKQKWSSDPRGNAWSKDKRKFGYRMLEKMGWSDGSGLGAGEDGATTHVKVSHKNNTLGLGTSTKHADNWIEHQSDFDGLLASLQQQGPSNPTSANTSGRSSPSAGLQAKAHQSKTRINYNKFLRGKDISAYSSTDMSCILGIRGAAPATADEVKVSRSVSACRAQTSGQSSSEADTESEREAEHQPVAEERERAAPAELNTVVSTQSVQDYFAAKMATLRNGRLNAAVNASQNSWLAGPPSSSSSSRTTTTRTRTRKTGRDDGGREEDVEQDQGTPSRHLQSNQPDNPHTVTDNSPKRKKKRKKSSKEAAAVAAAAECKEQEQEDAEDGVTLEAPVKKKKKKSKKSKLSKA